MMLQKSVKGVFIACGAVERDHARVAARVAGHARWPGAAGAVGMQLGGEDRWQESDRVKMAWTPAR